MTTVIEASGVGKRYGRRRALADCTLAVPAGRVTGLVGPNGAGKTTLLQLAAGLLEPDSGEIWVLGEQRGGTPAQLARVGFVAQDTPVYPGLSVAGHLRMGAWLNQGWDTEFAGRRISQLGLDLRQRAGSLSGGQRAQLALTLATAKRPELLLASHRRLTGPRRDHRALPASWDVIEESHAGKQSTLLVRTEEPVLDPAWTVRPITLEDMVLAYMSQPGDAPLARRPGLEIAS